MRLATRAIINLLPLLTLIEPCISQNVRHDHAYGIDYGYVELRSGQETAIEYYTSDGIIPINRNITSFNLHTVTGIEPTLDMSIDVPVMNGHVQDASIFYKYGDYELFNSNPQFFPSVGFTFPLSYYSTESFDAIGREAVTFSGRALVIVRFFRHTTLSTEGGIDYSFDQVPTSVPASFMLRTWISEFRTEVWLNSVNGIGGERFLRMDDYDFSFQKLRVSYCQIGGKLSHTLGLFYKDYFEAPSLEISAGSSYVFAGENAPASFKIFAGVRYLFRPKVSEMPGSDGAPELRPD